jgi:hypothetical protein
MFILYRPVFVCVLVTIFSVRFSYTEPMTSSLNNILIIIHMAPIIHLFVCKHDRLYIMRNAILAYVFKTQFLKREGYIFSLFCLEINQNLYKYLS